MMPTGRGVRAPLIKLAAFAAVSAILTGLLVASVGNISFVPKNEYHAIFTDVTGARVGDDVRVAGVAVGKITGLKVKNGSMAEVTFTVNESRPLATSTRAELRYRNLIGQRYMALTEGPGGTQRLRDGGTIPVTQTKPALDLTVLFNGFKPLLAALSPEDVNRLLESLIKTLQGEGGTVASLLTHTSSLLTTVAARDQVIGRLIDNSNSLLSVLDGRGEQLSQMLVQLQQVVSTLAADRSTIGNALDNLNTLAETTVGLLGEGREPIRDVVRDLNVLLSIVLANGGDLDRLLQRIPGDLEKLNRVGSYGSWLNVYLCELSGEIALPPVSVTVPTIQVPSARCNR